MPGSCLKWNGLHFEVVMSGFYVVNLSGVDMVHYKGVFVFLFRGSPSVP